MKDIDIMNYLNRGAANAIKNRELARLLGITSREVYLHIERARNDGKLIISSSKGYYLPEVNENGQLTTEALAGLKSFYYSQRSRGIGCLRSAKSARLAIKEYERGQDENAL